ncbi:MAG: sulfur carrier protein ThiS [Bacteroidales bacterium]|nr:sulfur carrier protein ThiS [Bacteroidales bacterium]
MNVVVNNEIIELIGTTIDDLARQLKLPEKGVAVAVNMKMVPRMEWAATPLQEGAKIIVIKAASGG